MSPMAKTVVSEPPTMRLVLNRTAGKPSTPRSLRAFPVQLNHGALCMARSMSEMEIMGAVMPQSPAIFIRGRFKSAMVCSLFQLSKIDEIE